MIPPLELCLYATQVGQTKILLLRENRLTDISKKLVPAPEKVHPSKVFQNIITGKIFLHDKILLMTNDLSQYISWRGLRQILALGQIDQLESIIKNKENFSSEKMAKEYLKVYERQINGSEN